MNDDREIERAEENRQDDGETVVPVFSSVDGPNGWTPALPWVRLWRWLKGER